MTVKPLTIDVRESSLSGLVVARDSDVDEFSGRVHVGERNDGNVGVAALGDGLVIRTRVRHHNQPRLFERSLDLIGERARCVAEDISSWRSNQVM